MTLLGEGDPGPTSAMEDGSELRLEVMRGRKECGKPWSVHRFIYSRRWLWTLCDSDSVASVTFKGHVDTILR